MEGVIKKQNHQEKKLAELIPDFTLMFQWLVFGKLSFGYIGALEHPQAMIVNYGFSPNRSTHYAMARGQILMKGDIVLYLVLIYKFFWKRKQLQIAKTTI